MKVDMEVDIPANHDAIGELLGQALITAASFSTEAAQAILGSPHATRISDEHLGRALITAASFSTEAVQAILGVSEEENDLRSV